MRKIDEIARKWRKQMRSAWFDVSAEGILVCCDPAIGPLAHGKRDVGVVLNADEGRFELYARGVLERVFEVGHGVGRACRDAFGAYFALLEELCRREREAFDHAAA